MTQTKLDATTLLNEITATTPPQTPTFANWTFEVVSDEHFNSTNYEFSYDDWINNELHYIYNDYGEIQLCGNLSSAL